MVYDRIKELKESDYTRVNTSQTPFSLLHVEGEVPEILSVVRLM